jgi:type II secretory pathway component PulF
MTEIRNLRKPSEPISIALDNWIEGMNNGSKLSDVIRFWVSQQESMLILAGEKAGTLDVALRSVVKVSKAAEDVKASVISGLAYPTLLLFLAFGSLYLFSFKIVPAFSRTVQPDAWTGLAKTMIVTANFFQNWLSWLAVAFVCLIALFFYSLPRWNSSLRVVLDRYVPYNIYRIVQGSSWLIALSAIVQAGERIEQAVQDLGNSGSPWSKARSDAALKGLRAGRNLGDALMRSGYEFPDREIISDLRLYGSKSGFDQALLTIGNTWITESVDRLKSLMAVLFVVTMAFAGGLIMFIVSGFIAMQLQLTLILQRGLA